ncbi:hypothetical protein [Sorangium sp. So ce341]|uniref:hypothetical protein n=1 Tax=Sorangium sp. So ce341 TaxID=3133302 RepID=UPI003F639320
MQLEARGGWAGWMFGIGLAVVAAAGLSSCKGDEGRRGTDGAGGSGQGASGDAGSGAAGGGGSGGGAQDCPIKSEACAACQADLCGDHCTEEACRADWIVAMDCMCPEQVAGGDVVTCIGTFEGKQPEGDIDYCVQAGCADECGF